MEGMETIIFLFFPFFFFVCEGLIPVEGMETENPRGYQALWQCEGLIPVEGMETTINSNIKKPSLCEGLIPVEGMETTT